MTPQEFKEWIEREIQMRKDNGMHYSALLFIDVLENLNKVTK